MSTMVTYFSCLEASLRTAPSDNLSIHKAFELIRPGDVIVIDGGGDASRNLLDVTEPKRELETLIDLSREKRVAIMCAEAVPWRCHRSLVSDALIAHGILVIDIFSEGDTRPHKLTAFGRVNGTQITYPPDQATLL